MVSEFGLICAASDAYHELMVICKLADILQFTLRREIEFYISDQLVLRLEQADHLKAVLLLTHNHRDCNSFCAPHKIGALDVSL